MMVRCTMESYVKYTDPQRGNLMFENLHKAEKLSEHSMLFAEPKQTDDRLKLVGKFAFVQAYIEILPAGLIEDEL